MILSPHINPFRTRLTRMLQNASVSHRDDSCFRIITAGVEAFFKADRRVISGTEFGIDRKRGFLYRSRRGRCMLTIFQPALPCTFHQCKASEESRRPRGTWRSHCQPTTHQKSSGRCEIYNCPRISGIANNLRRAPDAA